MHTFVNMREPLVYYVRGAFTEIETVTMDRVRKD